MTTNKQSEKMYKAFYVSSVCREDLIDYIGREKAMKMEDSEMERLASKMGDIMQDSYWEAIDNYFEFINFGK